MFDVLCVSTLVPLLAPAWHVGEKYEHSPRLRAWVFLVKSTTDIPGRSRCPAEHAQTVTTMHERKIVSSFWLRSPCLHMASMDLKVSWQKSRCCSLYQRENTGESMRNTGALINTYAFLLFFLRGGGPYFNYSSCRVVSGSE